MYLPLQTFCVRCWCSPLPCDPTHHHPWAPPTLFIVMAIRTESLPKSQTKVHTAMHITLLSLPLCMYLLVYAIVVLTIPLSFPSWGSSNQQWLCTTESKSLYNWEYINVCTMLYLIAAGRDCSLVCTVLCCSAQTGRCKGECCPVWVLLDIPRQMTCAYYEPCLHL